MRYAFSDCVLDTERCELTRADRVVALRPKVLQVLTYLIEHHERVVSKQELFDKLWSGRIVGDATLNSCLKEARRAVGDSGAEQRIVKTLHGHGYHFIAPVRDEEEADAAEPSTAAEKTDPVLSEREYKQVSVLALSISNPDQLSSDAEAMDESIRRFFAAANDIVRRYGGTLAERAGDGFTALFGAPAALEDHARRAVLAALEIRSLVIDRAESAGGGPFTLHCGLHTGSALVGSAPDQEQIFTAVGATVQMARRLRDQAHDTVLASQDFVSLIESEVDAEPQSLAGGDSAYRILRLARLRAGVPRRRPMHSNFVGRDEEMSIVRKRFRLAQNGAGQTVCISGEPGIGKSRLVRELRPTFEPQTYLQANCLAYRVNSPYFPLTQLLRSACGIADEDGDDLISDKLRAHGGDNGVIDESVVKLLLRLLDHASTADDEAQIPQVGSEILHQWLTKLVLRGAANGPLVIVIEDLHWLDPSSAKWVESFVARIAGAAVLLLFTYRPGYRSQWLTHSSVTQLALPRLNDADSGTLVSSLSTTLANSDAIKRRIVSSAQGNPFFLEELTHDLAARNSTATPPVPTTVQAVLASRIDQLGAADKSLLQMAAVIGSPVPQRLLTAVVTQPVADIEAAIRRLEAAELLFEKHTERETAYHFRHALTEDVAYQSQLGGARRAWHRRIAQAYEERFPDQAASHPEILAHHFGAAGLPEQAMDYWTKAGIRAALRSANPEAVLHFEQALAVSEELPKSVQLEAAQLNIYLRLGPPLMSSKAFASPSVERAYVRARRLCRAVGSKDQLFTVLWGLWLHYAHLGNIDKARDLVQQILELSGELSDPALKLQAHHAAWTNEIWHGDLTACKRHALEGAELYDPDAHQTHRYLYGGHDPGVCAYGTAGLASWFLGYPEEAQRLVKAGADLASSLAHPFSFLITRNDFMELGAHCGDPAATLKCARESIDLCIELNVPNYLSVGRIYAGWGMAKLDQLEDGLALLTRGIDEYARTGAERNQPEYLLLLADICVSAKRCGQGLESIDRAEELIERTGEVRWAAEVLRLRGELLLAQSAGNAAEAAGLFEQAGALAAAQSCKGFQLRAAMSLASVLQQQGEPQRAIKDLQPLYEWFSEGFATEDLRRAKQLLSALA